MSEFIKSDILPLHVSAENPQVASALEQEVTEIHTQLSETASSEEIPPADPFDPSEQYFQLLVTCDRQSQASVILALCNSLVENKQWSSIHALLEQRRDPPPDVLYFHALVLRAMGEREKAQQKAEMSVRKSKIPTKNMMFLLQDLDPEQPDPVRHRTNMVTKSPKKNTRTSNVAAISANTRHRGFRGKTHVSDEEAIDEKSS